MPAPNTSKLAVAVQEFLDDLTYHGLYDPGGVSGADIIGVCCKHFDGLRELSQ
jgi:hypothetical protein